MWEHTEAIYRHSQTTGATRTVLLYLAHRANENNLCWPSQSTIVDDTGLSRRSVQNALKELQEAGEIDVIGGGLGRGNHTIYEIKGAPAAPNSAEEKAQLTTTKGATDSEKAQLTTTKGATDDDGKDHRKNKERSKKFINGHVPKIGGVIYEGDPPRRRPEIQALIDALDDVAREMAAGSKTLEDRFEDAAFALFGYDATPEKVRGFGPFWAKEGRYDGPPALTSILNQWKAYDQWLRQGGAAETQPLEMADPETGRY